jgi:hypothetical protein
LIARPVTVQVEAELVAFGQSDGAIGKFAEAQLWALKIKEHANWATGFSLDITDGFQASFVILMGTVAEVKTKDIGPIQVKLLDRVAIRTGWAEGGDNFGITVTVHVQCPFK